GQVIEYYPSGEGRSIVNYTKNQKEGIEYQFYRNGMLKEVANIKRNPAEHLSYTQIIQIGDSTGHLYLDSTASGKVLLDNEEYKFEGEYINGNKHGLCKKTWKRRNLTTEIIYDKGKFISGKRIEANGKEILLQSDNTFPMYPGGLSEFYKFLNRNLKYPEEARKKRIEGRVVVGFVVAADGSINNTRVVKSVHHTIDQEAVRIILLAGKWIPGIQDGIPARVAYNVVVMFKLQQ
ncbi:TonB family protein, partial [Pseudoxanthomonas sp. SGD-10]